jgi:hypothetical protein
MIRRQSAVVALILGLAASALVVPAENEPDSGGEPDPIRMTSLGVAVRGVSFGGKHRGSGRTSTDGSTPIAQPFALDVPAREIRLGDLFESVPAMDSEVHALGRSDGQAIVVVFEEFQVQSMQTSDGASFSGEVIAAGGSGQLAAKRGVATVLAGDGFVYAATRSTDPAGDLGIQFVRSDDMGQSWSTPIDLLTSGDPTHGVGEVQIDANTSGRVAVAYRWWWGAHPLVRVSSDRGDTWTAWVRVDSAVAEGSGSIGRLDVAVDPDGTVHVVYSGDVGSGWEIFYTRSTDGGLTFEPERSLASVIPAGQQEHSENPTIAIGADGSVLVAFWDRYDTDRVYVVRSTDGGVSFGLTLDRALSDSDAPARPVIGTDPSTSTVILGVVDNTTTFDLGGYGPLTVQRSSNNGAGFYNPKTLAAKVMDTSPVPPVSIVRTPTGSWAVGWRDGQKDSYAGFMADLYVATSTNGGASWSTAERVNADAQEFINATLGSITTLSGDMLLPAYCDTRDDTRGANVYSNRSAAGSLDFSLNDQRIDTDTRLRNIDIVHTPTLASDGVGNVYVALQANATGPYWDIYVAKSADNGYSFTTVERVSSSAAGEEIGYVPQIAATVDGYVYVAFKEDDVTTGQTELRFNRSSDFGATWQPVDTLLGTVGQSLPGWIHPEFQLVAVPGGRVFVAWSDGDDVFLARSTDGGGTFDIADVDQRPFLTNGQPSLCAQGSQVVLVYHSPSGGSGNASIWSVVSDDEGENWSSATELRTGALQAILPFVTCGGTDKAVAVWSDRRPAGVYQIHANRYDSASWQGDIAIGVPSGDPEWRAEAVFASSSNVVVTYYGGPAVRTILSTDGGASFSAPQRLDDVGLNPGATSASPNLATDGLGNVWVSWWESSAGELSIAVRHSDDFGETYGSVRRLNRELPQGAYRNTYWLGHTYSTAVPGAALFTWAGERDSVAFDALVSAWDLDDFDRDQTSSGTDCDDEDPGVHSAPSVVSIDVERITGAVQLSWPSQAASAGPATRYDVVSGTLADLRSNGTFAAATCLADDHPDPIFDDTRGDPGSGNGDYYLVRAQNGCGAGTFDDSSLPVDPRDALDAGTPCP